MVLHLKFYMELYNAAKEIGPLEDFLITYHIENYNTSKPINTMYTDSEFNSTFIILQEKYIVYTHSYIAYIIL